MEVGERIRQARIEAGLTQAGLAGQLGLSERVIGAWESGTIQNPTPENLARLAVAVNRSARWILSGDTDQDLQKVIQELEKRISNLERRLDGRDSGNT